MTSTLHHLTPTDAATVVTVTVAGPPTNWGWPTGSLAVLSRHGGDNGTTLVAAGGRWTLGASVTRHRAAMALSMAPSIDPDLDPVQIAATILAVLDTDATDRALAGANVALAAHRRTRHGIHPTPQEQARYRRYWPDPTRTALCLALADRLLAYAAEHPTPDRVTAGCWA